MKQVRYYIWGLALVLGLGIVSCSGGADKKAAKSNSSKEMDSTVATKRRGPKFEFTKEIHKFGAVTRGEIVVCNFYYKNTGNSDLIITNVEASCGCTAVKWDKQPLAPGKEARISVEFNSSGRYGKQYKTISIFANIPETVKELVITAEVQ